MTRTSKRSARPFPRAGWAYQYSGGSGANGHDYYLFGQGRWGFSPWDNPERCHYESALTHAPKATAPFQFFDHYLKDAPAPKWMTDGVPYLKKDEAKEPR
jgi:hypothetical protein